MATINFNANEVEPSQEFQPLPEGKYEAVISDSDVKSPRNSEHSSFPSYMTIQFFILFWGSVVFMLPMWYPAMSNVTN